MAIRVGIAGLGLMGHIHLRSYVADGRAEIAAVADVKPDALESIESAKDARGQPIELESVRRYTSYPEMLSDDSIDAVSICSPTREHVPMTIAALEAGKHVLVEKPLGLTSAEANGAVGASARRPDLICMPAMCIRFWPAWRWLRETIADERYGAVISATFTRIGAIPTWASFYREVDQSGGAILDLHIHDADFVRFCFGDPEYVTSLGSSELTRGIDHVITHYQFEKGPAIVIAEGGWISKPDFEFSMRYLVNFEKATATYNNRARQQLRIDSDTAGDDVVELPETDGWQREVTYFLDCIEKKSPPTIVTMRDGAEAVRLVEAERVSVETGKPVRFNT